MATRSPSFTPKLFKALAHRPTSSASIWYVSTRESPGSPSQISAALLRRGPSRCRSRQLYAALIVPPRNHLANGKFHSSVLPNGLNQCRLRAHSAQNASGSESARLHSVWYSSKLLTHALALNSADGGNLRDSVSVESICVASVEAIGLHLRKRSRLIPGQLSDREPPDWETK